MVSPQHLQLHSRHHIIGSTFSTTVHTPRILTTLHVRLHCFSEAAVPTSSCSWAKGGVSVDRITLPMFFRSCICSMALSAWKWKVDHEVDGSTQDGGKSWSYHCLALSHLNHYYIILSMQWILPYLPSLICSIVIWCILIPESCTMLS